MEEIKRWAERNILRREERRERIKAMLRRAVVLRAGERIPVIGDNFGGGVVVSSFPETGDPNIIVEIPDDVVSIRSILRDRILEERDENPDYSVLGFDVVGGFDVDSEAKVGDTYPIVGITEEVRQRGNYGAGDVISGVGDTGFYPEHDAYIDRNPFWWSPWSPTPRDGHGHGSHVSGLQFGRDPWGIATDSACAVFQVLNDQSGTASESDIANAFRAIGDYVLAQRVRAGVFNFSLGGRTSGIMKAGVAYMIQRNVWPICAAGNDGPNAAIGSPGDAPGVVCVGAADRDFAIAPFSSGGGTAPGISCFSEGVNIASVLTGTVNGQKTMSGTSMATPHVTALFTLLAAAGMGFEEAKAYVFSHMQTLSPACANGRGLFVIASDFGAISNPPIEPPPNGGEPPMSSLEETDALCDEQIGILDSSGTEYDLGMEPLTTLQANYPNRMPASARNAVDQAISHLKVARYGPDLDNNGGYVRAMDLAWEIKTSLPKVEAPPVEAPPTKPPLVPDWLKVGVSLARYGGDPRNVAKLTVPSAWRTAPMVFLWHGGGWVEGDYNVIPQAVVLEVNDWFTRYTGCILIEPTYRLGNVVNCMLDAGAAAQVFVNGFRNAGASGRVFYGGHSAGGHLAWSVALNPAWHAPTPAGVFSLAGAGLAMHANTRIPNTYVEQRIFNVAWGPRQFWENYAPASHVRDRAEPKIPGCVVQGSADDQLDPNWAVEFQRTALDAGHNVTLDMQPGGNHFSVANPAMNTATANDIKRVMGL